MPTPQKQQRVAALRQRITEATGIYLSDFSGISVGEMNDLRAKIIAADARLEVAKNRLLKLAFQGTPSEVLTPHLRGPTAVTFCWGDALAPARVMRDFGRQLTGEAQRWTLKAAFVDRRLFSGEQVEALATLPSAAEIKANVVGALAGPANALVHTLNGILANLVYTLQAVADKRGAGG